MMNRLRRLAGTRVGDPRLPADVALVRGSWIPAIGGWLSGMGRPAAAVTLGSTIVVGPGVVLEDRLLRHELAHVRQWRRRPLAFPLLYALAHVRHGYRNNPYEVEARAAEGRGERSEP
jgi:hypothetical protein